MKVNDLSEDLRFEIGCILYNRMAVGQDLLRSAKLAEWDPNHCPKSDWPLFQESMLKDAQRRLDRATAHYQEFRPFIPDILAPLKPE